MPTAPVSDVRTPADRLREALGQAEILVANLKGAGHGAVRLLELLDEIDSEYARLAHTPLDLRPEEGRIEGLLCGLRRRKTILDRELRPMGGLARLRAGRLPAANAWWWFLDHEIAAERGQMMWRYGKIAFGAAIVLMASLLVYRQFFQPDPLLVEVYANQTGAMDQIMQGDYAGAITYLARNLELEPAEAEWPIRLGVLQEIAGDPGQSQALFERGLAHADSEASFYLQRAQAYYEVARYEQAVQDAEHAIGRDASLPMAYLILGRSHAGLGRNPEAIAAFEQAIELSADSEGNETTYVLAKMDLMQLYQSSSFAFPTPTTDRSP
jgi:tetratricopeptide (TPR) repeat protein